MVILTMVINGLGCKKLFDYLEVKYTPEIKIKMLKQCTDEIAKRA
jgi:hypothetical protein